LETWDDILTAHGPAAYRAAWRVLGHAADAEDAVQDALLDGLRLHRRGGVACWAALLRKLCVRRALDRLRRRRAVRPVPADCPAGGAAPDAQAAAAELEARFRRALTTLAPREAEVFGLHYFADLDNPAIAAQLDLTTEAVAAALYKARRRLRTILFPEDDP
jgi:RNA polymerase sigma-70 factor (ECF subfamily)